MGNCGSTNNSKQINNEKDIIPVNLSDEDKYKLLLNKVEKHYHEASTYKSKKQIKSFNSKIASIDELMKEIKSIQQKDSHITDKYDEKFKLLSNGIALLKL